MESREGCARAGCYPCPGDCLCCNLLPCSLHTAIPSRRQGAATVISDRQEQCRTGKYPSKSAERDIAPLLPRSEVSILLSDHRATGGTGSRAGDSHVSAHPCPVTWLLLLWARRTALGRGCACPAQAVSPKTPLRHFTKTKMVNKQKAVLGGTTPPQRSQGREGSDSAPRPHNEIVTGRKGKLGCLSPCAGLYPPVPTAPALLCPL